MFGVKGVRLLRGSPVAPRKAKHLERKSTTCKNNNEETFKKLLYIEHS
ncbi:hypothetical protein QUF49_16555 [Fictibacillus sp. b24]|nr:hypothetical protein [Fictibacillus sp. b24]MDM5317624.1 hypothetical protein [Fictibacillus sp. b24]